MITLQAYIASLPLAEQAQIQAETGRLTQREQIAAIHDARRERAHRWLRAGHSLRGYPTLPIERETPETLAAAPPATSDKARPRMVD
jgi:hypothetical protein